SPFDECALLTIDGVGEWTTTMIGRGLDDGVMKGSQLRVLRTISFPHSLGLFYSAMTKYLGFEVNEGEYKVMGLSGYGTPQYVDRISKMLHIFGDGSFWIDIKYFMYHRSAREMITRRAEDLLGRPARHPRDDLEFDEDPTTGSFGVSGEKSQFYADVAASVQL